MQFNPSQHSYRQAVISMPTAAQMARMNGRDQQLKARLDRIENAQVTSAGDMASFINSVHRGVELERGKLDEGTYQKIAAMREEALDASSPADLAKFFGLLRAGAGDPSVGAPKTAQAIKGAARWFEENVNTGGSSSAPSALDVPDAGGFDEPFYEKDWFLPVVISGSVLFLGIIIVVVSKTG
jgi:hypothetical protein